MMPALVMRDVVKRYRAGVRGCSVTVRALRGASLDVGEGEVVGVVGGVGAGKSTLLLCAAGLLRPDEGIVQWFGIGRLSRTTPPGVVYVAERAAHYGFLTVREAVEFHATLHDAAGRELASRAEAALDRVVLAGCADRRVGGLGRGTLRRVALAQALVRGPRLLLLDELLTDVDGETRRSLRHVLRGISSDGVSVVVSAREPGAVAGLVDRELLLERGVVRDDRTVAEAREMPIEGAHALATLPRLPARVAEGASAVRGECGARSVDPAPGAS